MENITNVYCNDYDMYLYKDGKEVAKSTAMSHSLTDKNTNYEIIELSPEQVLEYGAGYYQVKIERKGNPQGYETIRLGMAWEQP